MDSYLRFAGQAVGILLDIWWLWLPVVLFLIFWDLLTSSARDRFISSLDWVLLEIRIPRDLERTPKAMEQVFRSLHGVYREIDWWDEKVKGEMLPWFSFEIVGINGGVHFLVRTLADYRGMVESNIYAHYADAEIVEVNDYTENIPDAVPSESYDLWGTEFALTKEDAYPIRTYREFEEHEEEQVVDPLAAVAEIFANTDSDEGLWLQMIVQPADGAWQKEGRTLIDEKLGRKDAAKGYTIVDKWLGLAPTPSDDKKEKKLAPGEEDIVEALERNISQLGFTVGIRFIYWGADHQFNRANVSSVVGALKQYNTEQLNGFKVHGDSVTKGSGLFKKAEAFRKKKGMMSAYKKRKMPGKKFVLSAEELATIYHLPRIAVEAPTIQRIETRQEAPPTDLPIG